MQSFIPSPERRIGSFQEWTGVIGEYSVFDSDSCFGSDFPRAELFFARDDRPHDPFAVYLAANTLIDGTVLHCAPGIGREALPLQGFFGMCPALSSSIVPGKTHVRLRVWFQVGRLQAGLQLLPSTDRIDVIPDERR